MPERTFTIGRDTAAAVDENGVAFDLRRATYMPYTVRQVKVYVAGDSYVGFSRGASDDNPIPAATDANSVYQLAEETEVYTVGHDAQWLYVYAVSTSVTHVVYVSLFG